MELTPKLVQLFHETFEMFRTNEVGDIRRRLTVALSGDADVGAVTTRSASKTRGSKAARALG